MTVQSKHASLVTAIKSGKTLNINCWRDAAEFLGLEAVHVATTPLFERTLCRVTKRGKDLLEDYFSFGGIELYGTSGERTAWNEESLGYASLNRKELIELSIFCAARNGEHKGFLLNNSAHPSLMLLPSKELVESYASNRDMFEHSALYEFVPKSRTYNQRF